VNDFHDKVQDLHDFIAEQLKDVGEKVGKPGWFYHDLPRMQPVLLEDLKCTVGNTNLHWLTKVEYVSQGTVRGQVLVHPDKVDAFKEWLKKLQ
jgi:hypothetical protein